MKDRMLKRTKKILIYFTSLIIESMVHYLIMIHKIFQLLIIQLSLVSFFNA